MGSASPLGNVLPSHPGARGAGVLYQASKGMSVTEPSEVPVNRSRTIHYQSPDPAQAKLFEWTGLEQLRALIDGTIAPPPISSHVGLEFVSVADGEVVMTAQPDESHYNPIGSIHGGFFATVLDSACGCAVHSTLPAGVGYTSLELKVSFLRPITAETGIVTARGWVTAAAEMLPSPRQTSVTMRAACWPRHRAPA